MHRRQFMKYCGVAGAGAVLGAGSLSSSLRATERAIPGELIEAAKREGSVMWYTQPGTREIIKGALAEWKSLYPSISVEIVEGSGPEIAERLRAERRAKRYVADVATVGDNNSWELAHEDTYVPFDPAQVPNLERLLPEMRRLIDPEHRYLPTVLFLYGINVNTNRIKEEDIPVSWHDLLDPKYKGLLSLHDPSRRGGGAAFLLYGWDVLGERYFEQLMKQDVRVFGRVQELESALVRGERAVTIPGRSRTALDYPEAPIRWVAPKEGIAFAAMNAGLVKNSPHPNAAVLWLNFILGEPMQKAFAAVGDAPVVSGVKSHVDLSTTPLLGGKGGGTIADRQLLAETLTRGRKILGR